MTYGCYNRLPFGETFLTSHGEVIPFRMTKDCRYQADDKYADPGCAGCSHKKLLGEVLDGRVLNFAGARSSELKAIDVVEVSEKPAQD